MPVSFSCVAQAVEQMCPVYGSIKVDLAPHISSTLTDADDNSSQNYSYDDHTTIESEDSYGESASAKSDSCCTVSELLQTKQCQRYFTILRNPGSQQLYVSAKLQALISNTHLRDGYAGPLYTVCPACWLCRSTGNKEHTVIGTAAPLSSASRSLRMRSHVPEHSLCKVAHDSCFLWHAVLL